MNYLIEPEKNDYLIEPEPETPAQPQGMLSKAKDTAISFGVGANSLLQMAGDFYGLATGDMGNVVSQQARENIQFLQQRKSPELRQAEEARRKAIEAQEDELGKALTYVRETVTNPSLLSGALAEQLPNLVGTGGAGALAKKGAEKVLLKTAADQAAKRAAAKRAGQIGVGTAVATGAGMQGTDVGADLYDEAVSSLDKITDEQARSIPEIARLMDEKGASLDEAKTAFALALGREAFALGATISAGAQMLPGGRTVERAFVGRGVGRPLAGMLTGALGEAASEAVEEGGSRVASNILARSFEPERPLAKGVGEAVGQAVVVGGVPGGAFGAISSSRPVPEGEVPAGKSDQPPAPAATKTALGEPPKVSLEESEKMTPEQFWATVNVRQARLMGGEPSAEDLQLAGEVPPPKVQIDPEAANRAIEGAQQALQEWVDSTANAPQNVRVIYDPELLHNGFGVQGYYNPDGSIAINAAFVTPDRVASIANHEWAHVTLATEAGQKAFADFVQREIPQAELDALAARYNTQDRRVLLEEWIAQNQEKAPGVIERIVARIREWLAGLGVINLSDAEVADIMLRTLRQQVENRIQPDTYESMQPAGERLSLSETGRAPELTPPAEILTRIQDEPAKPGRPVPKSRFYVSSVERGRDFADAIARAAQDHPRGAAVEVKPPEFYSDPENFLFFAPDNLAGAAVKPDGDLVSVFKHPTSKTRMKEVLADAAERAIKLDAFDIDSYLPQLYSNFGFRPVARVAFNDEIASPNWNFADMGRPDVVLMVKDPDNILGLPDSTLYTDKVRQQVPLVSYEEAARLQQEAVDKLMQAGVKFSLTETRPESRPDEMGFFSPLQRAIDTMPPGGFSDYVATPAVAGRSFPARTIRDKAGNVIKEIPARTEPDKPARIVTAEEQLRSHLEKYNVKKEEMDDIRDLSGQSFSDWIKDNSKATKDQIAQFVAENQVSVTPVTIEEQAKYEIIQDGIPTEIFFDSEERAAAYIDDQISGYLSEFRVEDGALYNPNGDEIRSIKRDADTNEYVVVDPEDETSDFGRYTSFDVARRAIYDELEYFRREEDARYNIRSQPWAKYEDYTLPGGENYQEDVLTLPVGARGAGFRSNHYPEISHYLAHVRTKDRVTTSGRPVLFVEEIQSDLHQRARERGYRGVESPEAKAERLRKLTEVQEKLEQNGIEQDRIYTKRRELENDLTQAFKREDVAEQDRLTAQIEVLRQTATNLERIYAGLLGESDTLSQTPNQTGLPNAPFKKTWHEMAFKYLLHEAVRNGVDYLAWTTGKQQNDRYPGLETQVRAIEWNTPATYELPIALRDGRAKETDKIVSLLLVRSDNPIDLRVEADGTVHPLGRANTEAVRRMEGASLSELIGAGLASRILNEPSGRTETQDLVIDSDGMSGFYDQILPQFAAKYLKKFGVKPQKISVVLQEQTEEPSPLNIPGEEDRTVTMPRTAAEVNAVLITPEMEQEFRTRGQPRYSLTSAKPRSVSTVGVTRETLDLPSEGRVPISAVAKALNDMSRGLLGGEEFDDDQLAITHGVMNAVAEGRHQLLLGDKSGADWYDTDIDTAKKYLRRALPGLKTDTDMVLFTAVMAPTSFNQNPVDNISTAVRIYEAAGEKPWGNLPPRQPDGRGWTTRAKAVELGLSRLNQLVEERGERGAVAWLLKKHPISELRKYNKLVKGKANDLKYGAYIFGPKGGPFFLNMNGIREEMTKDLWWSRTFNRWFGTMEETVRAAPDEEGEAEMEQEEAEEFQIQNTPRNDAERRRMDAIANQAAQRLGLTIEELQATLWYYEQQLWKRLGAKVESYSYKDGALRILEKRGIERPRVRRSDSPNERRRQAAYLLAAAESRPRPVEDQPAEIEAEGTR